MPGNVPPVADEREGLVSFLAQQRYVVRLATFGLTDEQARATPSASAFSLGGLLKHLALVERNWAAMIQQLPRNSVDEYMDNLRLGPDETLASALQRYEDAARATDALISSIPDLGQPVPVPRGVPWFPQDVEAWSVRWVLLHLIQETARHAGHADIIRESLDGATAMPLMAAAEGWPASPWLQPWQPPAATPTPAPSALAAGEVGVAEPREATSGT
jgi:uncharacterized damage-inducible protein DinB